MKTPRIIGTCLTALAFAFAVSSCDSKLKEQVADLQQRNEELAAATKKDSAYIASMNAEMDELYANLDSMRAREERIRQAAERLRNKTMSGKEGSVTLDESFSQLEKLMAQNQQKIASLQKKLSESGKKNEMLQRMVEELNKQVQDKDQYIGELKTQVQELQTQVEGLKVKYSEVTAAKEATETKLNETTDQLNTVYYVVGTKKDLENRGLIDTRGLFKKLDGLSAKASDEAFVKGDMRYLKEINAGPGRAKNIEVIPKRDETSYQLSEQGGEVIVTISNPSVFWKQKYVAIVVK